MEDEQIEKMSKTSMLLITGCSFFIFSYAMKILDGVPSRFLLYGGFAAIGLGVLSWIAGVIKEIQLIRKKRLSRQS